MRYARLLNTAVCEIWDAPEGMTPSEAFHPSIAETFVPCPDGVEIGFVFDGSDFAPVSPEEPSQADLRAYAAQKRWLVEVAGTFVGGIPVATDDRSKIMIMGARMKADTDPGFTTNWKAPGGFQTLDAAAIIAISDAVSAHVDACFAAEAELLEGIEGGTVTTREEIDAANWPV